MTVLPTVTRKWLYYTAVIVITTPQWWKSCKVAMAISVGCFNPSSPNSDQHQFSPNNIHRLSRAKSMRINKMITSGKML